MKKTAEEIYDDLRKRHKGVWSPKDTAVMAANIYAEQFKPKWIEGYVETLKADLKYSIDLQEQQINESLNRGREEGIKYALEMLVMHLPSAPERKEEGL